MCLQVLVIHAQDANKVGLGLGLHLHAYRCGSLRES